MAIAKAGAKAADLPTTRPLDPLIIQMMFKRVALALLCGGAHKTSGGQFRKGTPLNLCAIFSENYRRTGFYTLARCRPIEMAYLNGPSYQNFIYNFTYF